MQDGGDRRNKKKESDKCTTMGYPSKYFTSLPYPKVTFHYVINKCDPGSCGHDLSKIPNAFETCQWFQNDNSSASSPFDTLLTLASFLPTVSNISGPAVPLCKSPTKSTVHLARSLHVTSMIKLWSTRFRTPGQNLSITFTRGGPFHQHSESTL